MQNCCMCGALPRCQHDDTSEEPACSHEIRALIQLLWAVEAHEQTRITHSQPVEPRLVQSYALLLERARQYRQEYGGAMPGCTLGLCVMAGTHPKVKCCDCEYRDIHSEHQRLEQNTLAKHDAAECYGSLLGLPETRKLQCPICPDRQWCDSPEAK